MNLQTSHIDYAEHTVALQQLARQIPQALRDKKYESAEELVKEAMKRLARIHGWISFYTKP